MMGKKFKFKIEQVMLGHKGGGEKTTHEKLLSVVGLCTDMYSDMYGWLFFLVCIKYRPAAEHVFNSY